MELASETKSILKVIAEDLELLAILHSKEISQELLQLLKKNGFPDTLGFVLRSSDAKEALSLLNQAMADLNLDEVEKEIETLATDFAGIYLNNSFGASPFESVWIDEDNLVLQDAMFEIRKWYEKYNLMVENWRTQSDDHFAHQFRFISHVLNLATNKDLLKIARFMDEHLFRWFDDYVAKVARRCDTAFYAGLHALSYTYVNEVRDLIARITHDTRPTKDEVEARFVKVANPESVQYIPGASVSW